MLEVSQNAQSQSILRCRSCSRSRWTSGYRPPGRTQRRRPSSAHGALLSDDRLAAMVMLTPLLCAHVMSRQSGGWANVCFASGMCSPAARGGYYAWLA
jgi:hypothetical protein